MKKPTLIVIFAAITTVTGNSALAGKVIDPTPELKSAISRITNGKIAKVELGRSGLDSTYEIEFDASTGVGVRELEITQKDLAIVEAEGRSLEANTFVPGNGLKPVSELAASVAKYPVFTAKRWELEKKFGGNWVYEVKGTENGLEKEYHFDAKNLALVKTEVDD